MKKKLILSFAMLVGASSALSLVASAESMYQDIISNIVNSSLIKDDQQRLDKLYLSLDDVRNLKINAEWHLINSHGNTRVEDVMAGTLMAGLSALALSLSYVDPTVTTAQSLVVGGFAGFASLSIFAKQYVERYFTKKKLAELNEVIAKLETMKTELENKVAAA